MNITVEKKPKSITSLIIEIPWDEVRPYLERAAREYSEKVATPGFRKGQVPYTVIEQRLGIEALLDLAQETLVSHTYLKALQEHGLETVGAPQVDIRAKAPYQQVKYEAVVAVLPEVTLASIAKLTVKKNTVEVTVQDTERIIKELQRMRATEREIIGPAEKKHKVTFSYRLLQDKLPLEGSGVTESDMVLGETPTLPGFSDHMIGMKAGEEKKFSVSFPNTWSRKDLAGRTVEVELMMKKIAAIDLPAVDDTFAASVGNFRNADELREKMHDNLRLEKEDAEERRQESAAVEALIQASTFGELPDILIEGELDRMREEIAGEVQQYGVAFKEWLKKMNKTPDSLRQELRPQATARVKASLVLRRCAEAQKIIAEDKEILEEIEKILSQTAGDRATQERIHSHAFHEYLKNQIVTRKTLEWLKSKIVE